MGGARFLRLSAYLADLRAIRNDLKRVEGRIALGLNVVALLVAVAWAIVSIGFNPPNDSVTAFMYRLGLRPCRPVSNFGVAVMLIDMFMLFFLTLVSFGNAFNMMRRANRGLPRAPHDLIVSSSLMLVVGIGGIVFMLAVC